jgi:hypothetical protein
MRARRRSDRRSRVESSTTPGEAGGLSAARATLAPARVVAITTRRRILRARIDTHFSQYESELITSPPATVPSPRQTIPSIVLLTNRTEPSASRALTPAGW